MASAITAFALALFTGTRDARGDYLAFSPDAAEESQLLVALMTVSSLDVDSPPGMLAGVFLNGPSGLAPQIPWLGVPPDPVDGTHPLSLESGFDSAPPSANLGIFETSDRLPHLDPESADGEWTCGDGYGFTKQGNEGIGGHFRIHDRAAVMLSGWSTEWSLPQIKSVYFRTGRNRAEPDLEMWVLLGAAFAGLALYALKLGGS